MSDGGFLSRWARLKSAHGQRHERSPAAPGDDAGAAPAAESAGAAAPDARPGVPGGGATAASPAAPACAPAPELPPVETLTPESDFRPFMQKGVEPAQRASALRRLFADPHFNVMDGLDVYIDDYGKPDPIPPAMLRGLVQARTLGLFDEAPPGAQSGAGDERPAGTGGPIDPGAGCSAQDSCGAAGPDAVDGATTGEASADGSGRLPDADAREAQPRTAAAPEDPARDEDNTGPKT